MKYGPTGEGDHTENEVGGLADAKEHFTGKHKRAQIQAAVPFRNPAGIKLHQLLDRSQKIAFRQFWHRHAAGGFVKAAGILFRTEQHGAAIRSAVGLHPFKNFLRVMQHAACRINLERRPRRYLRPMPALVHIPLDHGHMVSEQGAETEIFKRLETISLRGRSAGRRDLEVKGSKSART